MSTTQVKFLLVDDLEGNLLALEGLLRRDGLALLKARSGREALELLLVHEVALAFIDVQMPEMDGFELAEFMRGAERTRSVPIIFVTAGATDNQRHFRGYELGAVDFLFKPLDPHVLRSKAEVFFELARQRDELKARADENARLQRTIAVYAQELEQTVADRTARLRETVHELEAFSYSIAHDMRAPLRTMDGFATVLLEDHAANLDGEARHYLERIAASARRLDDLIQDVLNYSRIVREDLPVRMVDVRQLAEELLESYPNLRAAKTHVNVAPDIPAVTANPAALTQVVSNLLSNAVKFVSADRTPVVRVWGERLDRLPGGDARGDGWVRLWFEDNGIGIEPGIQPRLFEMFQRFNRPGLYEGTGMGLAIARKAAARMGGLIGVESEPGRGSRFWVILPAAEPSGNG
jgi:signal transduction histidine kinase